MSKSKRYRQLDAYLRELADLVGLKDWEINLLRTHPTSSSHAADIAVIYGRRVANIQMAKGWHGWDAKDIRQTLVHELLHCHINHVRHPIDNVHSIVGENIYRPLYASVTDYIEYAIDPISEAWAVTLPLPKGF